MKVLMAGDLHGDLPHAQYLVKIAKKQGCDRILQLGDFGYWPHYKDGQTYLNQLNLYADLNNILVYWVDGNHDKTSRVYEDHGADLDPEGFIRVRKQIRYAPRGHRWTWDGCRFIALGGAYSVDKDWRLEEELRKARKKGLSDDAFTGDQWFPEEEMSDEDMDRFLLDTSPVDVIVAHDKPRGSNPKWNRKEFLECTPNQDRLQRAVRTLQPAMFFHGHLHYFYADPIISVTGDQPNATLVIGLHCNMAAATSPYDKAWSWQVLVPGEIDVARAANAELLASWGGDEHDDNSSLGEAAGLRS
jgi:predicted phosphodiesterase